MQINSIRQQYIFRGIIQGVGFRPTVYRCAVTLGLTGFVLNQRSEVMAEIEGKKDALLKFPGLLKKMLPKAALIEKTTVQDVPSTGDTNFRIMRSQATTYNFPPIPPDLAICPECREELLDASNRRYLYPFITCTQCGPRYSIVEDTPFDRETTSMIDFPQCPDCLKEYTDPMDRRFHSQTNSCRKCGPQLRLQTVHREDIPEDPLIRTIRALQEGKIIAIQGIGGFHLAAVPENQETMVRLRRDKERERKPFAVMLAGLTEAEKLCRIDEEDFTLLNSFISPIMIFPLCSDAPAYLKQVSHTGTLGIMLPYTPLHLLLFHHPEIEISYRSLIMTSGNLKGEPIVTEPDEAFKKLEDIADLFLYHNRRIIFRTDDSVIRTGQKGGKVLLRRSRGYVPRLITLKSPVDRIALGVGGDLKSSPALARKQDIYLAPYLGDLEDPLTRRDFEYQISKILSLFNVQPEVLIYDLHPLYHSTRWAQKSSIEHKIGVQHHHAHLLSVMAEHQLVEAIGLAFDGTGYGSDGTMWGGEFLYASRSGFKRLGCYIPFPLPGGEAAIKHPIRITLALLAGIVPEDELKAVISSRSTLEPMDIETLLDMIKKKVNSPISSSAGRIFDAAAALLGLVEMVSYEGEGPIRMEGIALRAFSADPSPAGEKTAERLFSLIPPAGSSEPFYLDIRPVLRHLAFNYRPEDTAALSFLFHRVMAESALEGARILRKMTGLNDLALSGGVFQNILLRELLLPALKREGFQVYTNTSIPPGDGGIAIGQVYFKPDKE